MISWDRLNEPGSEFGNDDFAEVVTIFLDEVETVLARMAGASGQGRYSEDIDFSTGSALDLGFRALAAPSPRPATTGAPFQGREATATLPTSGGSTSARRPVF